MATGGIDINFGHGQHGAKRALCLCEMSGAFVTISCSTHLLFISLHPFSSSKDQFLPKRVGANSREIWPITFPEYLLCLFIVLFLGAAYFDSLTLQSKLDEAALLTGAAGATR